MIDVLYFAWVRERIGLPKERVETSAATVMALVEELKAREERYEVAFADLDGDRFAEYLYQYEGVLRLMSQGSPFAFSPQSAQLGSLRTFSLRHSSSSAS